MNIAIVEDEKIWSDKIEKYVRKYFGKTDIQIKVFSTGEKFLQTTKEYQLVFMDIELPNRDGFSILQEYRIKHADALFIILTTHIELSRQGYKVEAFRYIDKFNMDEIAEALDSAMLRLEKYQIVEIPIPLLSVQKIQCYDIVYFEVYDHDVLMHLRNEETYRCSETLLELSKRMTDKGFILTNRSYLVNLEHIRKVEKDKVYILGNQSLPLSRRKFSDVRKIHFEWKMRRANG